MTKLDITYETAQALFKKAEAHLSQDNGDDLPMWREIADGLRNACQIIPKWTQHGGCVRLAGDGWMVSYKESPSDSDSPETALHDRRTDSWYMLVGDHRNAYESVASEGWEALFAVFTSLQEQFAHEV